MVATGNPKDIRKVDDLHRRNVALVNREPGSGSRALLDGLIRSASTAKSFRGYDRVAYGHLAAAHAVLVGEADCCVATRSAAQTLASISYHSAASNMILSFTAKH